MDSVSLVAAAAAGVVSFLSPCVLPLVPGYLAFVSGISYRDLAAGGDDPARRAALVRVVTINAVAFVLGFASVFVALGASATTVGQFLGSRAAVFTKIAGAVIILFGLHTLGLLRIPWLYREKRVHTAQPPRTLLGAYAVGMAFAFGWTPCIGPVLGGVLTMAATRQTVAQGVGLLAVYSLGLGVPFLAAAVGIHYVLGFVSRFRRYVRGVEIAGGVLLVAIGFLVFFDRMTWLSQQFAMLRRFAL
jgi:cytochrome c-type biogenesis protein